MSYDITIAGDDSFSVSVPFDALRQFVSQLPRIEANGTRGFVLREGDHLWMEIDLDSVTEDGDTRDDGDASPTVNCVRLHIPYPFLGKHPEHDYFPIAVAIAQHLGWPAIDEQTGQPLQSGSSRDERGLPR